MSETTTPAAGIDKEKLYGEFMEANKQKRALYLKAAHKALDIPDDDMQLNQTKIGIGAGGIAAIAAAVGLPGLAATGVLAYALLNDSGDTTATVNESSHTTTVDERLEKLRLKFYTKNEKGELVEVQVPHVSQLEK